MKFPTATDSLTSTCAPVTSVTSTRTTALAPGGTGALARIQGILSAGKTGTAENPHGKDHAWYVGFAPFDNPKIAVAVMLENSGFGGAKAAPIAGMIMEKYLYGELIRNKPKPVPVQKTVARTMTPVTD
mgnify:CR=1 FL=1